MADGPEYRVRDLLVKDFDLVRGQGDRVRRTTAWPSSTVTVTGSRLETIRRRPVTIGENTLNGCSPTTAVEVAGRHRFVTPSVRVLRSRRTRCLHKRDAHHACVHIAAEGAPTTARTIFHLRMSGQSDHRLRQQGLIEHARETA